MSLGSGKPPKPSKQQKRSSPPLPAVKVLGRVTALFTLRGRTGGSGEGDDNSSHTEQSMQVHVDALETFVKEFFQVRTHLSIWS